MCETLDWLRDFGVLDPASISLKLYPPSSSGPLLFSLYTKVKFYFPGLLVHESRWNRTAGPCKQGSDRYPLLRPDTHILVSNLNSLFSFSVPVSLWLLCGLRWPAGLHQLGRAGGLDWEGGVSFGKRPNFLYIISSSSSSSSGSSC